MVKKSNHEVTPEAEKKDLKPAVRMVPLFSWQTLITIVIGLIVGIALAIGYWIVSPSLGMSETSGEGEVTTVEGGTVEGGKAPGLFGLLGMEHTGTYESRVKIQIVSPGSEYITVASLQQRGEYYAAKASSLPFFEFLSQELAEQIPGRTYTINELDNMIATRYDWNSQLPTILITVVGNTEQEAVLLAELVPQVFKDYLIVEESEKQRHEYQNTLAEIESVKAVLYTSEQELNTFTRKEILNDPDYIALSSRVEVLQRELDNRLLELGTLITMGDNIQREYEETMQKAESVGTALIEAEQKLREMDNQGDSNDVSYDVAYIMLNSKIAALESELERLMTGYVDNNSGSWIIGLAEMIVDGINSGTVYENRIKEVETTSEALAESRRELNNLETQMGRNSPSTLEYRLAQINVDILSSELSALQERLALLGTVSVTGENPVDMQSDITKIAAALSETKNELTILEEQLGYDRLAVDLDYQVAQEKVDNLNEKLEDLTSKLSSLVGEHIEASEITGYLIAGKPSIPFPLLPERPKASSTLMMGAIGGIVAAWVILNFRWIVKGMPTSSPSKPDEDEKE